MPHRHLFCNSVSRTRSLRPVRERDHAPAITTAAETASVHPGCLTGNLVEFHQQWAAGFVVVDGRGAGLIHQPAEHLQVGFFPGLCTLLDTFHFGEEMVGAAAQILG